MKILFIIPPVSYGIGRDLSASEIVPHPGIASLSAYLKQKGNKCFLIDGYAEKLSTANVIKRISIIKPDIIGISSPTATIIDAGDLASEIKIKFPGMKIVIGGWHASALPEQTMKEFPCFDYLISGYGEESFGNLITELDNGGSKCGSINGLAFRRDGEIVINPQAPPPDLNSLPLPDFKIFRLEKYKAMFSYSWEKIRELPVQTSRGCPYDCTFCYKMGGKK